MRNALYSGCPPEEVDQWFEAAGNWGAHLVGVAVFVAVRPDGRLGGLVEIGLRPYAEGCKTTPVAFIEGWYVDPDLRGSGLGRELVETAESWARDKGLEEIGSGTELGNAVSLAAHLSMGYQEVERQICFRKHLGAK